MTVREAESGAARVAVGRRYRSTSTPSRAAASANALAPPGPVR